MEKDLSKFNKFEKIENISDNYHQGFTDTELCELLDGKSYRISELPTFNSIEIVDGKLVIDYDSEDYTNMYISDDGHLIAEYIDKGSGRKMVKDLGQVVPNITIGTVTTGAAGTEASVTNTGTPANPVLNFTIPQGKDGNDFTGTITSDLIIEKDTPSVQLHDTTTNRTTEIRLTKDTDDNATFEIYDVTGNGQIAYLPFVTGGRFTFTYNIMISKSDPYVLFRNTANNDIMGIHYYGSTSGSNTFGIYDSTNTVHMAVIPQNRNSEAQLYNNLRVHANTFMVQNDDTGYGQIYAGKYCFIQSNQDGGNVRMQTPGTTNSWEFDSLNSNLRMLCYTSGSVSHTTTFFPNGNVTGLTIT